jgi:hypothetical protein
MNSMLNVWAMQKDMPLKVLLIEWQHRYGAENLRLNLCEHHFQAVEVVALGQPKLSFKKIFNTVKREALAWLFAAKAALTNKKILKLKLFLSNQT